MPWRMCQNCGYFDLHGSCSDPYCKCPLSKCEDSRRRLWGHVWKNKKKKGRGGR